MEESTKNAQSNFTDFVFGEHFQVTRKIGHGTFGTIFEGCDTRNGKKVAIKLESERVKFQQLSNEAKIYSNLSGFKGFPKFLWYGKENGYNVLVIELLSITLEELKKEYGGTIPLKHICFLADKMIADLEILHKNGFVHRDLKPENFMLNEDRTSVYLIDFGLSKNFIDPITRTHIRYTQKHELTGTARYASISALFGNEQSRRDDLEALCYILIYFYAGALPWQGLNAKTTKEKYEAIRTSKQNFAEAELYNKMPHEFVEFLDIVRKLAFQETPNYYKLRYLFRDLSRKQGWTTQRDWEPISSISSDSLPLLLTPQIKKNITAVGRRSVQASKVSKGRVSQLFPRALPSGRKHINSTPKPYLPQVSQIPPSSSGDLSPQKPN